MTIRTFDAVPLGTVPGATLFQLNEQRAEEGELCYTADYKKLEAELQKYKDQFPDYVECANCGSVTHVEGVEHATGQSGCQIGEHDWVLDPDEDYFVCRSCGETT